MSSVAGRVWLGLIAALLWAGVAAAQDLAPIMGPLAPAVALGTSGSWTVLTERGRVVLSDADDQGAVRFYTAPWQGDRAAGRSTGVRVQATGMGGAAAGLVYAVRNEFPRWVALVVTPDKNVVVYARQASGLVEAKRVPIPGGLHADGELLQVSERGATTTFFANGVEIGQLTMASAGQAPAELPVGVLAIGTGRFTFRDFAFGQAVVPAPTGDDRVPGRPAPMAGNDDRVGTTPAADKRRWPVPQLDPLAGNVLGATMGILAHELGHFMIGELKIPATGPEEDVADEFAAMVFIDNMRDMPDVAGPMALALAKFWWYEAEDSGDAGQPPWFDEHAPDRARFGRIMCMLYGASPQGFEDVMRQTGIPERTRARCIDDERKRHAAWDSLLRSHRRRGVDPVMPGDLDPATPGKRMTVEYRPSSKPHNAQIASFLQQTHMLDTAADLLSKLYVLPRDTKIIVAECGQENCFYNPTDGSVTLCYEMLDFVMKTFATHEGATGTVSGETGDATPASAPAAPATPKTAPKPPGTGLDLAQFLAGIWRLQQAGEGGLTDDILIEAQPDGSYRSRHNINRSSDGFKLVVAVAGRWAAEPVGNTRQFRLVLTPVQWSPHQVCAGGNCQPFTMDPTGVQVQIVDANTLVSSEGRATRVQ